MVDMMDIPIPPEANMTIGRCPILAVSKSREYGTRSSFAKENNSDLSRDLAKSISLFKHLKCRTASLTFPTIGATRDIIL